MLTDNGKPTADSGQQEVSDHLTSFFYHLSSIVYHTIYPTHHSFLKFQAMRAPARRKAKAVDQKTEG